MEPSYEVLLINPNLLKNQSTFLHLALVKTLVLIWHVATSPIIIYAFDPTPKINKMIKEPLSQTIF